MMEKWKKNAWRSVWTQRRDELVRACARYPDSDRYPTRQIELQELNAKLEDLDKE
jgi:hypothetical protein